MSFVVTCLNTIELRHRFFIFHPPHNKEIVESWFIFVIFWSDEKLCSPTFCQRARVCLVVYYNIKLHLHYMYVRVRYRYILLYDGGDRTKSQSAVRTLPDEIQKNTRCYYTIILVRRNRRWKLSRTTHIYCTYNVAYIVYLLPTYCV